jgi:hypothetical protein
MNHGAPARLFIASLCLAALATLCAADATARARKEKPPEEKAPEGPAAHLMVAPRHGFRPLTITLTGTLTGVEASDPEYCHAGIEWEARSASGLVTTSRQDPKCLHPPEQVAVQFSFTKVVTIHEPGTYTYRFIVHKRDGSRMLSNTQEVRVLNI